MYFEWDGISGEWTEDNRYEFLYDQNGNITSWASFNKEVVTNRWLGDWNHEFAYDKDGIWVVRINYWDWDVTNKLWIPTIKRDAIYDNNNIWKLQVGHKDKFMEKCL
jgi:hypothetical protein